VNPKLIILNGVSNSVLSKVLIIAIIGVYVGAIYYYTHISLFYFSESWERFTFIGYGAVLFILVLVFGRMSYKVNKMLNALGPYKKVQEQQRKVQEIKQENQKLENQLEENKNQILQKLLKKEQETKIQLRLQELQLQEKAREKQLQLQEQKRRLQEDARKKIQQEQAKAQLKKIQLQRKRLQNL
jgi:flagellar biosynthesis GTPase FlhF